MGTYNFYFKKIHQKIVKSRRDTENSSTSGVFSYLKFNSRLLVVASILAYIKFSMLFSTQREGTECWLGTEFWPTCWNELTS